MRTDELARAAFHEAPVAAAIVRLRAGLAPEFVDVNRALCRVAGGERDTVLAGPVAEAIEGFADVQADMARGTHGPGDPGDDTPGRLQWSLVGEEDGARLVMVQIADVVRSRQVERALRESEKRVQDLVDNVHALIYIKAFEDGRYLLLNRHFEEIFGISRDDGARRTNEDFFPPDIAEAYTRNDRRVLETGVPMEFEERKPDGGSWLSLKFPLYDVDGQVYAVGGISTDISSRSRADAMVRQAKDQAERANQAKSEFLSRMSHELRTPLNSILGFGQLLQMEGDALPDGSRGSVDRIVKAGRHLLALINEVLEISRLEARPAIAVRSLDVCRPLVEAVELVRPLADERDVDIASDLHGGLYRCVLADQQRLTQVLLNILSNAIKYNRVGGQVRVWFRDAAGARLRLCVSDTGPGMSPEARERAFLPFERLGAERTDVEGTGLGLTLSRSLIEGMGGSIGIEESAPGAGTTFFVELPLVPTDPSSPPSPLLPDEIGVADLAVGSGTVLYIEDNLANLDLVEGILRRVGDVRVIPAVQGQIGIELAARHRPDLILLDLHLPDLDGEEVLRRLQADPRTAGIPVVVLSADVTRERVDSLDRRGAAAFVTKPIDVPVFLDAVRAILGASSVAGP